MQDSGRDFFGQFYNWIGRNTSLGDLMVDYRIQRHYDSLNSVRFYFNGSGVNPFSSSNSLKLEDGDSIDVIRRDGYNVSQGTETFLVSLPWPKGEFPITLKLYEEAINDHHVLYLIGRNTPLEDMFFDYVVRIFRFYDYTGFFSTRIFGSRIDPKKTADDLKLEDGDINC